MFPREYIPYIMAPLIGGLIGLITNGIAIRMLFRPLKPIKIGNWTVPFTPGLIPKEQPRLAKSVGQTIGQYLLDVDTLTQALASDSIKSAFDKKVDAIIEGLAQEDGTVSEYLGKQGFLGIADGVEDKLSASVSDYLAFYLVEQDVGGTILDYAYKHVLANMNSMLAVFAEPVLERARPGIARKIDQTILMECPNIVRGYIDKGYSSWMEKPMTEVGDLLRDKKEVFKEKIWDAYLTILNEKAGRFIRRLDVAAIVEQKINEFDASYLEKLIMEIARKELNALVWIGGLLGMVIGFANLLF